MDLGAYIQIEDLSALAKANGIEVPRLRGYRLMSEEDPVSKGEIEEVARAHEMHICEEACCSVPRFRPNNRCSHFSPKTRELEKKYCIQETRTGQRHDGSSFSWTETVGFRWELLHGKNRKEVKFAIKKGRAAVVRQFETFNKYAGREDVLYIHARIGGRNWSYYGGDEIAKQPWFLEKVDDHFDSTYCDIYALIDRSKCKNGNNVEVSE